MAVQIPAAGAGLGHAFSEFQAQSNYVIYHHFASTTLLDEQIGRHIRYYGFHKSARDLFQEIYNDRKKLCITYTRSCFNNGFVSTIISEARNSSLKASGRKEKMKSYTMADQCKMLMSWETSLDAKALDKIMSVLSLDTYQSRPWSQHVETAWDKAVADCHQQVIEVLGGIFILPVSRLLPPVFRLSSACFRLSSACF